MIHKLIFVLSIGLLTGCAKHPDAISPAYASTLTYEKYECDQLRGENNRLLAAYRRASGQQIRARDNDTIGVILLGIPVSTLSGDNVAPEVARLKGEMDAIHKVWTIKSCSKLEDQAAALT